MDLRCRDGGARCAGRVCPCPTDASSRWLRFGEVASGKDGKKGRGKLYAPGQTEKGDGWQGHRWCESTILYGRHAITVTDSCSQSSTKRQHECGCGDYPLSATLVLVHFSWRSHHQSHRSSQNRPSALSYVVMYHSGNLLDRGQSSWPEGSILLWDRGQRRPHRRARPDLLQRSASEN
jgi:hypothetical protein